MLPVAKALDKIQGEDQAYLGTLLTTIPVTIIKLKEFKSKELRYSSASVDALLAGIEKRFGTLMEDEECQLAVAFHPKFRLFWLEKYDNTKDVIVKVQKVMEDKVQEALKKMTSHSVTQSNESRHRTQVW